MAFYRPRTMSLIGSSGPMSGLAVENTRERTVLVTALGDEEVDVDVLDDDGGLGDDVGRVCGPKTKLSFDPSRPSRTISSFVSSCGRNASSLSFGPTVFAVVDSVVVVEVVGAPVVVAGVVELSEGPDVVDVSFSSDNFSSFWKSSASTSSAKSEELSDELSRSMLGFALNFFRASWSLPLLLYS